MSLPGLPGLYRKFELRKDFRTPSIEPILPPLLPSDVIYQITVDNSLNSSALTDFPVLLSVSGDPTFFSKVQHSNFIEFYQEPQKITSLKFFIEEWDSTNHNAKIWIRIPYIPPSSTTTVYLVRNKNRLQSASTITIFDFYDDFSIFDTDKWNKTANATVTVQDSVLTLTATANTEGIYSITTFSYPLILEFKYQLSDPTADSILLGLSAQQEIPTGWDLFDILAIGTDEWSDPIALVGNPLSLSFYYIAGVSANTWYTAKITRKSADDAVISNGAGTVTPDPSEVPSAAIPLRFTPALQTIKLDWVRTRPYTSPEPTTSYALV